MSALSFTLVSDAMRSNKSAQEALAVLMRGPESAPIRDGLSLILRDLMMSQTSLEALRAKLISTPKPVLASPTAGG